LRFLQAFDEILNKCNDVTFYKPLYFPVLQGAKSSGMKTAFLIRSTESGSPSTSEQTPDSSLDLIAKDFSDLANKLGT